jgi:4a-hydroxytetrahydrobiopterin dehydratase
MPPGVHVPGMADLLSDEEIADELPTEWERDGDEIVRVYEFDDYLDGVAFAAAVGEVADEEFHHPEIVIRWREVEVRLTSHEEGGITDKDIRLAELFDDER